MGLPEILLPRLPTATLEGHLAGIPDISALDDLPPGTRVWMRLDLDTPAQGTALARDARISGTDEVLAHGHARGWRMLLLAHRGQDTAGTLRHVHGELQRRSQLAGAFVAEWWSASEERFTAAARDAVARVAPGSFALFENTRRYDFEMGWPTQPHLPHLRQLADVASAYVMDAVATHNENFTTTALPAVMERVALGPFARRELLQHALPARSAGLLWLAGAKENKLRHLPGILARGVVEQVLAGGRLGLALLAARTGVVAADMGAALPAYARDALAAAERHGVPLHLPVDHVLRDGAVVSTLPAGAHALDVGPETRQHYGAAASAWLHATEEPVVYANGVMGRFEEPSFAPGTEVMIQTLVELERRGADVYIGGGEGRAALERYASSEAITHAFTAGGTLLRVLGDRPIPYLEALSARTAHGAPLA